MRTNPKGTHPERWRHMHGCGRFFNCVRDTVSDRILATYKAGRDRSRDDGRISAHPTGGRIDRAQPLAFDFDGGDSTGCEGDTLASALLANGVHLVGRSFKYHRPRGILSAGSEEPNALVSVDRGPGRVTPNLRATQLELYDGLRRAVRTAGLRSPSMSARSATPSRAAAVGGLLLQDLHVAALVLAARSTSRRSVPPQASDARRRA